MDAITDTTAAHEPADPDDDEFGPAGVGLGAADLPWLRRELFMDALAAAREDHDPATDWPAFCDAAWRQAGIGFRFIEREPLDDLLADIDVGSEPES